MNDEQKSKSQQSFHLAMRRFFREVQMSRILSEAKKRRYFSKDKNRTEKRAIARRKAHIKKLKRGY